VLLPAQLGLGFVVATSSLNIYANNRNDVISTEATMMTKEIVIERYGALRYTMGNGGSAASMQQHLLAENYPGLLDGLTTSLVFEDHWTQVQDSLDCRVFMHYFWPTSPLTLPGGRALGAAPVAAAIADGTAGGSVPATLALTLGTPASFGAFLPGAEKDYTATTTATVTSTAGDAALSVADPSSAAPGHLVNRRFSLPSPLLAGGSPLPATVKSHAGPVSNDAVQIGFSQHIGADDPLRTGTYAKTLTFTLSTTCP
jgi:hypothetical protein